MNTKTGIWTGWTLRRVLLLMTGVFIAAVSAAAGQWLAAAIGAFMAAMGLFGYHRGIRHGCPGGSCRLSCGEAELPYELIPGEEASVARVSAFRD